MGLILFERARRCAADSAVILHLRSSLPGHLSARAANVIGMTAQIRAAAVLTTLVLAAVALPRAQGRTPQTAFDELLAADREFSGSASKTDLVTGIAQMFADDVVMMAPGKAAEGKAAAIAALRGNPDNTKSRTTWMAKGGGVSADGLHGFTYGFMLTRGPSDTPRPAKYLAYWTKGPAGWKVVVYKRAPAAGDTQVSPAMRPLSLPARMVPPSSDAARVAKYRDSLAEAERSFSRDAQSIGLGKAFARYGRPDAINLGGPDVPEFIVGGDAIGTFVSRDEPPSGSSVSWGPDKTIVASSGDLGVTIGVIRRNAPAGDSGPAAFPFFTIWRRDSVNDAWRYIAE
jgi:ketosteroid isomerase-like protein